MNERYEAAANLYDTAAHAWTARGHMLEATQALDEQAREHARRSTP